MRLTIAAHCRCAALAILLSILVTQQARSQNLLAGAAGGAAGVAAGGYLSLSLAVAEARAGRYLTGMDEFLGWRSAPVLIGGATGAAIGFFDPPRLKRTVVYGGAGTAAGLAAGMLIGPLLWKTPEGRWAGGAIGAGIGMVIGSNYGLWLAKDGDENDGSNGAVLPVVITFRF